MSRKRKAAASAPTGKAWPNWALVSVLIALVVFSYARTLGNGFIWDDDAHVTNAEAVQDPAGLGRIWLELGATQQYYPLVFTAFWVQEKVWGGAAWGYHLVNIALHAVNVVLLWLILRQLKLPGAWFAAAVFAVHPVCVETVAWVSELKNLLSTCLYGLALLCYLRFDPLEEDDQRESIGHYMLATLLFAAALASKTVTCSLPAAVLVLAWWRTGRIGRKRWLAMVPWLALGAAMAMLTAWVEANFIGAAGDEFRFSIAERILIAGRAVWFYLGKALWPNPLVFIYPRWEIDPSVVWQWLYPAAAAGALVVAWVNRRQWGRGLLTTLLLYGGTLLPALGFVNVFPMRYSFVADHFQYLALPMLIAAIAALTRDRISASWPSAARWTGAVVIAAMAIVTFGQTRIYANPETLFRHTLEHAPKSWMAYENLGTFYLNNGRTTEAREAFTESHKLHPHHQALSNLSGVYALEHRYDLARDYAQRALELDPQSAAALLNLANAQSGLNEFVEAHRTLDRIVELYPDHRGVNYQRGLVLLREKRYADAEVHLRRAVELQPRSSAAYNNLGGALELQGKRDEALAAYRRAVELDPTNSAAAKNVRRLAGG